MLLCLIMTAACITGPEISGYVTIPRLILPVKPTKVIVSDRNGNHEFAKILSEQLRKAGYESEAFRQFDPTELEPGQILIKEGISTGTHSNRGRSATNLCFAFFSLGAIGLVLPYPLPSLTTGDCRYDLHIYDHDGLMLTQAHGSMYGACKEWWVWSAFHRAGVRDELKARVTGQVIEEILHVLKAKPVLDPNFDYVSDKSVRHDYWMALQRVGPHFIRAIRQGKDNHVKRLLDAGMPAELMTRVKKEGVMAYSNEMPWLSNKKYYFTEEAWLEASGYKTKLGFVIGQTALMEAANAGQLECARLLLMYGAYADSMNSEGHSVLDQVVDRIVKQRKRGDRPARASLGNFPKMVSLLLEYGANPSLGRAYKDAKWFKLDDITQLLEEAGAIEIDEA
jgi:hypothetical protein